jgi:hypothetical protein
MAFTEPFVEYLWLLLWLFAGLAMSIAADTLLAKQLTAAEQKHGGGLSTALSAAIDEFANDVGSLLGAALFLGAILIFLWQALGTPFYHFHMVLSVLLAGTGAIIVWYGLRIRQSGLLLHRLRNDDRLVA